MGRRLPDEVVYRIKVRIEAGEGVPAIAKAIESTFSNLGASRHVTTVLALNTLDCNTARVTRPKLPIQLS